MRTTMTRTIAVLTLTPILTLAAATTAQNERTTKQREQDQNQRDMQNRDRAQQNHTPHFVTFDEMKGFDIRSVSEESLGEIRDAVIHCRSGEVEYVLLEFGGTLGMGEKVTAVPYKAFEFDRTSNRDVILRLNLSPAELDQAPQFDADAWPTEDQKRWDEELKEYWKAFTGSSDRTNRGMSSNQPNRNRTAPNQNRDAQQRERSTNAAPTFCLASQLINVEVNAPGQINTDENSGHIDSLYLECSGGQLAFVGIDPDEAFADIGEVNRIVPFETITFLRDGKVRLDVSSEKMRSGMEAPDEARELDRRETRTRIYQHYGVEEREFKTPGTGMRSDRGGVFGWGPEVQTALKNGDAMDFSGRIERIHDDAPMSHVLGNMAIVVQTDAGERTIYVGRSSDLKAQLNLREGQTVEGECIRATLNGRTVHVLKSIVVNGRTYELRDSTGKPNWKAR